MNGAMLLPEPVPEQAVHGHASLIAPSWTFTLWYERPPKGLSANDRVHWGVKSAATARIRTEVSRLVQQLHIPTLQRCQVDTVWIVRDRRRRDADNAAPLMKAIYDAIGADKGVSAHIVPDDDPNHMTKNGLTFRHDKTGPARFEITITELRGDA